VQPNVKTAETVKNPIVRPTNSLFVKLKFMKRPPIMKRIVSCPNNNSAKSEESLIESKLLMGMV
jgi:hypothetical protein